MAVKDYESRIAFFRIELGKAAELTRDVIRELVENGPFPLDAEDQQAIIRQLESSFDITQKIGAAVKAEYEPWLAERRREIDFYYWERLKRYYVERNILPLHVISTLDRVTDEVLDYSGDPAVEEPWARRGMVMGHVQSGKTTNYASLICKAADAGYRVVILLAGITNTLRAQTQERLDETFIGKKSVFQAVAQENLSILRFAPTKRFPAYGTSRDRDFSKAAAQTYGVSLAALKEPIIFVTKKNKSTLEHLRDWLREQNHGHSIDDPLLLIDDEADNASINTASDPGRVTAINGAIREILGLFSRSTYIGYTATPFANIFIDPVSEHEMLEDDLFPRNFIKALDPPSNYVGASRIFHEQGDLQQMIRVVDDHEDVLPVKHRKDIALFELPASLEKAIRIFVIARTIRVLRGHGSEHASMMINVSRFNDVQEKIYGLVYGYLEKLKQSIVVNAGLGERAVGDPLIKQLHEDFEEEYGELGIKFAELLKNLHEGVESIQPRTVNMRGGELDYSGHKTHGLHVIAIGGLALSRGLTLEGLIVSYMLRNASASDTLMQMARWFGYRGGYEDICRLYLPEDSCTHYEYITDAIEELRTEVKRMERLEMTPKNFGLRVRQSPAAIRVTAANKMRNATQIELAADYSGAHVEGYALRDDERVNRQHLEAVEALINELPDKAHPEGENILHWSEAVDGHRILQLLSEFKFPEMHRDLGPIEGNASLFSGYLSDRISSELSSWDVAIPTLGCPGEAEGESVTHVIKGKRYKLRERKTACSVGGVLRVTKKNKLANPGDEKIGLDKDAVERAGKSEMAGARKYGILRERPLLLIHLLDVNPNNDLGEDSLTGTIASLSFCLPSTRVACQARKYQVNPVYVSQLADDQAEPDDDEIMLEDAGDE